jgi:hypothetical protein
MLRVRLQSSLDSVRRPAIDELRALAKKLRSGTPPRQLGLTTDGDTDNPAAQRFIDSYLDPGGKSFDLDAIRALTGEERAFAEEMLVYFALCAHRVFG